MVDRTGLALRLALALGVVGALLAGGCSGAAGPSIAGSAAPAEASAGGAVASPSGEPSAGSDETYTGILRSDDIEGGCTYVQAADGQKYEVIPPDGWSIQTTPAAIVAADGQVIARAGELVTVHGHEADMMSICQIGPIIQASDITAGAGG